LVEDIDEPDDASPVGDALLHYDSKTKDKQIAPKKPVYSRPKLSKATFHADTMPEPSLTQGRQSRNTDHDREPDQEIPTKRVPQGERTVHVTPQKAEISHNISPSNESRDNDDESSGLDARLASFERKLNASLVGQIETVVHNVLSGTVKQTLLTEFVGKLQGNVVQEVKRSFQAFFSTQVQEMLKASIKRELEQELGKELRTEFSREIIQAREITSKLSMAYKDFTNDVIEKVISALDQNVRDEFNHELQKAREVSDIIKGSLEPLKRRIKEELRNDISQDIKRQLPALFRQEIKDELVREIKDEMGNVVKDKIVQDISDSVKKEVSNYVNAIAKQRSRMALLNGSSETPLHLVFIDFNNVWGVANKFTTTYPNIRHLLQLLRELLKKYDDQFAPDHVSGFIYCSKYHEAEVNRVFTFRFEEDQELEAMLQQFSCEIESEKKMLQNGQITKVRDVDVLLATHAAAMIAKNAQHVATVTLVSGDGDLNPVLDLAKQNGIHTIVFSFKHGTSSSLKFNADEMQFLDKFPEINQKSEKNVKKA